SPAWTLARPRPFGLVGDGVRGSLRRDGGRLVAQAIRRPVWSRHSRRARQPASQPERRRQAAAPTQRAPFDPQPQVVVHDEPWSPLWPAAKRAGGLPDQQLADRRSFLGLASARRSPRRHFGRGMLANRSEPAHQRSAVRLSSVLDVGWRAGLIY